MTGSKSLGDTGFLQFLGLFQVIMANPDSRLFGGSQTIAAFGTSVGFSDPSDKG